MDWIFDNLQFAVAVIVFIVWTLSAAKKQKEAAREEEERRQRRANQPEPAESDEEARTREIQEEIRRRILARQRGETAAPPSLPAERPERPVPVFEEPEEEDEPEYLEEGPRPRTSAAETAAAAILEQQRRLEEQLQAVRAARALAAAAVPRLPSAPITARPGAAMAAAGWRRHLRRELRHPVSVRRALLLKEILGEPVGLQRGSGTLPRR